MKAAFFPAATTARAVCLVRGQMEPKIKRGICVALPAIMRGERLWEARDYCNQYQMTNGASRKPKPTDKPMQRVPGIKNG
jgi:hypothetical protein